MLELVHWLYRDRLRSTEAALKASNVVPRNVRFEIEALDSPLPVELLTLVRGNLRLALNGEAGHTEFATWQEMQEKLCW